MKGCEQSNPRLRLNRSLPQAGFEPGTATSVGQLLTRGASTGLLTLKKSSFYTQIYTVLNS